jgi:hypothetical protein
MSNVNPYSVDNNLSNSADLSDLSDLSDLMEPMPSNTGDINNYPLFGDPLTRKPRASSVVLSLILGLVFLALAAGVYFAVIRTLPGQEYEDIVYRNFADSMPAVAAAIINFFTNTFIVQGIAIACGIVAIVILFARHRWRLFAQLVIFSVVSIGGVELLKHFLPRPLFDPHFAAAANSAPSGHTALAMVAVIALVCSVPRALRALSAVVGSAFVVCVGFSVIAGQWHRPSDVVMAILIELGLAFLMLSTTRGSAMDKIGTRKSSISVQIISTVLIAAGICGLVFSTYVIVQLFPGLSQSAQWITSAAVSSSVLVIASVTALGLGIVLALRQLTASPLSRAGVIGAPPVPPAQFN